MDRPAARRETSPTAPARARTPRAATGAVAEPQDPRAAPRAAFRDVIAVSEYRALWLAFLLSIVGDQLARVAMTLLVYDRTRSPLLTALTYAVTFLPWIIGGIALSGIADRLPRRQVMIVCDLSRLLLVSAMVAVSLTGTRASLWIMVSLLFVVTLFDSPFKSARAALVADILTGEKYVLGTAISQITLQVATVAGFALGGVAVAFAGARGALGVDAATFAASALLLLLGVRRRPAASGTGERTSQWAQIVAGMRVVFGQQTLRTLVFFGWLVALYEVSVGLAVPYAAGFHSLPPAMSAGLVFAAAPFGAVVGALIFGRLVPPRRRLEWMGPLATAACGLLLLCWLRLSLPAALAVFTLSGACGGYQLAANAAFVAAVEPARRGQAFGLANGGMQVVQGAWFVAAGAIAGATSPETAIGLSGALGAVIAASLARTWHRRSHRV